MRTRTLFVRHLRQCAQRLIEPRVRGERPGQTREFPRSFQVGMPGDAAYRLGHDAAVEHRVRRTLTPHVCHAHLPVPRDVDEAVRPAHVPAPERAHPPKLLLGGFRCVPAVQQHLLQVDHVTSQVERVPQLHSIHRVQRLGRHGRGKHAP